MTLPVPTPADISLFLASIREGKDDVWQEGLSRFGANIVNARGEGEVTPLMQAATYSEFECLRQLIENGANLNDKNEDGLTALALSVINNNDPVLNFLIEAKADITLLDNKMRSPVLLAARHTNSHALNKLIKAGADVNQQDYLLHTPLMKATLNNNTSMIKTLLTAGADIFKRDSEGKTASDIATRLGLNAPLVVLLRHEEEQNALRENDLAVLRAGTPSPIHLKTGRLKLRMPIRRMP